MPALPSFELLDKPLLERGFFSSLCHFVTEVPFATLSLFFKVSGIEQGLIALLRGSFLAQAHQISPQLLVLFSYQCLGTMCSFSRCYYLEFSSSG